MEETFEESEEESIAEEFEESTEELADESIEEIEEEISEGTFEESEEEGIVEELEELTEELAEENIEEIGEKIPEETFEESEKESVTEELEKLAKELAGEAIEEITGELPEEAEELQISEEPETAENKTVQEEPKIDGNKPVQKDEPVQKKSADAAEESTGKPTRPVVERDKARVRTLTREERELFAPFIQSRGAKEQLVQTIDSISLAAYTGNVIITGEEGMDTLTLAKNMIREVQMTDSNFSGKVAKISGNTLNNKDIAATIKSLKNGALIIQKASGMNKETAAALNKSLQQESIGIIVVLEDTKKAINHFLEDKKELHSCFTARMDVEALGNDTLVAFGRQYAKEMEYSIDEMGILALHTRIENLQTSDHVVTVMEVKEIVDAAIRHANRKTLGHFFDVLLAKRYDDEDMIILGEKDFA